MRIKNILLASAALMMATSTIAAPAMADVSQGKCVERTYDAKNLPKPYCTKSETKGRDTASEKRDAANAARAAKKK